MFPALALWSHRRILEEEAARCSMAGSSWFRRLGKILHTAVFCDRRQISTREGLEYLSTQRAQYYVSRREFLAGAAKLAAIGAAAMSTNPRALLDNIFPGALAAATLTPVGVSAFTWNIGRPIRSPRAPIPAIAPANSLLLRATKARQSATFTSSASMPTPFTSGRALWTARRFPESRLRTKFSKT